MRRRYAGWATLIGLILAVVAVLAFGSAWVEGPIFDALYGPDPCHQQYDPACFAAHPTYWHHDSNADAWIPAPAQATETIGAIDWPAAFVLAVGAGIISLLALAMGTGRRRIAFSALGASGLVVLSMVIGVLGLWFGGGGD